GHLQGEVLRERNPGNPLAPRGHDVIRLAALDPFQQGQAPAARAEAVGGHRDVADLVADQRHGAVGQVPDYDLAGLPGPRGPAVAQDLDQDAVAVDVQAAAPLPPAGADAAL